MSRVALSLWLASFLAIPVLAAAAAVPAVAPGDLEIVPAVNDQNEVAIAAGGGGCLVVWQEERAVLSNQTNTAYAPLMGNQLDIYGARLDAAGNLVDATPIVICNLGRNQTKPRVAWNGQHWLVVFMSQRPDWYFFEDVMGVRVAPDGTVLDPTPIMIRPELNDPANYGGNAPEVGGDETNGQWYVVWEDFDPNTFFGAIRGTRVSAAGTVLDPTWPYLYLHNSVAFGPRRPLVAAAGGKVLVAWRDVLANDMRARVLSTAFVPQAPPFTLTGASSVSNHDLVSNGSQYLAVVGLEVFRLDPNGLVLDPGGIALPAGGMALSTGPGACWNGHEYVVTFASSPTIFDTADVYRIRVSTTGAVLDTTPRPVTVSTANESWPEAAGVNGATQFAFTADEFSMGFALDVRGAHQPDGGAVAATIDVSVGRRRQEYVQAVAGDGVHLAVYASRASGSTRLLAQRFSADGPAIDAEPILVRELGEFLFLLPASAWNGHEYLITWSEPSAGVLALRYDAQMNPLDAAPIAVLPPGGHPAVGALGGDFLVAATYVFSGDQQPMRGARVRGGDGAVLDATPFQIAGSFVVGPPSVEAFGSRWLVTWERRPTHDSPSNFVHARFVEADGTMPTGSMSVSASQGLAPDVAIAGDRALIVYGDDGNYLQDRLEGRVLNADGTFAGGEFLIAEAPNVQSFPTASSDGTRFLVSWIDYRSNLSIEQMRGDLWGARVTLGGAVLDPGGVQLTSGPLPEDLPDQSSVAGRTLVFYSALGGAGDPADVQRIHVRRLDLDLPSAWLDLGSAKAGLLGAPVLYGAGDLFGGDPLLLTLGNAAPSSFGLLVFGTARVDLPFLGGTLVPSPDVVVSFDSGPAGGFEVPTTWPVGLPSGAQGFLQAWIADPSATHGAAASNGLQFTTP